MNIQSIDFLPPSYHQERLRHQKKLWHRSVVVVFLVCIVAGTIQQQRTRLALQATRDRLQQEADRMTAQLRSPDTIKQQIRRLDLQARLITHLRLRVPPTRIIAAVANNLPPYVTLTDLTIRLETAPVSPKARDTKPAAPATTPTTRLAEEIDLDHLHATAREMHVVVTVGGFAPDDVAIACHLASLQAAGLFSEVKLLFTDEHLLHETALRKFGMRLALHPPSRLIPTPGGVPNRLANREYVPFHRTE